MSTRDFPIEDVSRVIEALGPAARVAYAATHVYPLAAPVFENTPRAERVRPACDHLRLYAHVPFCDYACSFCIYATVTRSNRGQMQRYLSALERELEWIEPGTSISQLFVGGGTPTALPPEMLDRLLESVFSRVCHNGQGVHCVETSPESVTPDHLQVLKNHGIGRVSMGIQSLDDRVLGQVNRRHSAEQALAACRLLVDSGLLSNVDLIYGLPGQSQESFRRDLEKVAEAGIKSVTLYNLRLNEATLVAKVVSDQERLDLGRLMRWRAFVKQAATDLGYTQTRWHMFEKKDGAAKNYARLPNFNHDDIQGHQLGVGMSANSHLGSFFYRNHRNINTYIDRIESGESPVEDTIPLGDDDRKTLVIARSLGDGKPLDRAAYHAAFGCILEDDFGELLGRLREAELIDEDQQGRLVLADTGSLVHDLITLSFYPEYARQWLQSRKNVALGQGRSHAP